MKRKVLSVMLASAMLATMFTGCGDSSTTDSNAAATTGNDAAATTTEAADTDAAKTDAAGGSVYYLNFKPEQDQAWQDLAATYTEQTGVPVTVITAADGTYEQTLKSEIAKTEAPTLFQVNGPVGLANWKDYCLDLSNSEIYSHLTSDDYALKNDAGEVSGIAYVIETYGIIYNKTILNDYCTMDNAVISSPEDINNFETLKAVADDIQARLDEINDQFGYDLKGAFTSAGMDGSSDWRFKTHLANLPIYYEYKDKGIDSTDAIEGTYLSLIHISRLCFVQQFGKGHTNTLKLSAGLRTQSVECSRPGKTRIIKDAGRGMVRNTGFYGQICLGQISSGTFGSYFSWYHS